MEFEVLHRSKKKKFIIAGCFLVVILVAIVLGITFAKYRVARSIPLASGTINYVPYDFSILAMYQQNDSGEYEEVTIMPDASSYTINTEQSYCNVNGTKDGNAVLETIDGHHTIANLQVGSKCYVYFDTSTASSPGDTILGNVEVNEGTPNFSQTATTDEGVYKTEDNLGTSYYFRGAVTNNYVSFAGYYWRIIRINGDGSIRIIYDGKSAPVGSSSSDRQTGTSAYNSSYNQSYYVGYTWTSAQRPSSQNSGTASTIKGVLDTWYSTNISGKGLDDKVVSSPGFCNDRNTRNGDSWVSSGTTFYYAAYGRLVSAKTPTLECSNTNDIYTTKVGLITADEVSMAGGVVGSSNSSYYLYTGQYYWTMSPYDFDSAGRANVFLVDSNGGLSNWRVSSAYGVRPVLNLSANVTISSGNGTSETPYVVS